MALQKKKSRKWIWIGLVVLVAAIGGTVAVVAKGSGTKIDPSHLGKASKQDIARSVVATGKVTPITEVELKSKASGIVTQLKADANDNVKTGQVLAQLDQAEILAQVAAQKANLQSAEAAVGTFQANVAQDRVTASAPDLPLYRETYQRQLGLLKDGIVSQQSVDDANRNYQAALNKRDQANAQIQVDEAKLRQAQAQVAQARANLGQLEEQLSYTTIVSPIDGEVLSRDVQIGDAVSSILVLGSTATQIMTLGDTHQVYVKGKVDESDIGHVYLGQPARIKVESFKDKTFYGKVTKIVPLGVEKDNVTTFEVWVSIDNPGGELKANMTANAEIILEEHKNVITVPEQALIYDNSGKAFVEVPDPKQKEGKRRVAVTAGISNGTRTEITNGINNGDTVVLQQ